MRLIKSKEANPNYLAKIVWIDSFRPHPNADKLKLCTVDGNNIAVGIDSEVGKYIYFPLECQLSPNYLKLNNLYRNSKLNSDSDKFGFFEEHGRIKCIKLRGLLSQGLVMPIDSLKVLDTDLDNIEVNTEFDYIGDTHLCWKYVVRTKNKGVNLSGNTKKSKKLLNIVEEQFRYHIDTEQLGKNMFKINPEDLIQISLKEHGTSAIFCNLLVKKQLTFKSRIAKWFNINVVDSEYKKFCSSRKVVKDPILNKSIGSSYYDCDIWNTALDVVKDHLQKGMTLYAEITGYMPTGSAIQGDYDYGCVYDPKIYEYSKMTPKQMYDAKLFNITVYRITGTNIDGRVFEYSAKQVQDFCKAQGLNPVIEFYYGFAKDYNKEILKNEHWHENFLDLLKQTYLERKSEYCVNPVPEEGIVLRKETNNIEVYKLKSLLFLKNESVLLDLGVEDIESNE